MRVCEFARAHISCPSGKKILVDGAVYGRQSRTVCQYKGKQRVDSKHRKNTRCNLGSQGQWSGVARRGLGGRAAAPGCRPKVDAKIHCQNLKFK